MRETTGYPVRTRTGIPALLTIAVLALGVSACGDGDEGALVDPGATPAKTSAEPTGSYRLANGGKVLVDPDGTRIPVDPKLVTGYVDAAKQTGKYVDMSGWAAPADLSQPADVIVAIVGKASVATAKPSGTRPDLVEGYNRPGLEQAGFVFSVPRSALDCSAPEQGLKTFAVAGDAAGPLEWLADVGQQVAGAC